MTNTNNSVDEFTVREDVIDSPYYFKATSVNTFNLLTYLRAYVLSMRLNHAVRIANTRDERAPQFYDTPSGDIHMLVNLNDVNLKFTDPSSIYTICSNHVQKRVTRAIQFASGPRHNNVMYTFFEDIMSVIDTYHNYPQYNEMSLDRPFVPKFYTSKIAMTQFVNFLALRDNARHIPFYILTTDNPYSNYLGYRKCTSDTIYFVDAKYDSTDSTTYICPSKIMTTTEDVLTFFNENEDEYGFFAPFHPAAISHNNRAETLFLPVNHEESEIKLPLSWITEQSNPNEYYKGVVYINISGWAYSSINFPNVASGDPNSPISSYLLDLLAMWARKTMDYAIPPFIFTVKPDDRDEFYNTFCQNYGSQYYIPIREITFCSDTKHNHYNAKTRMNGFMRSLPLKRFNYVIDEAVKMLDLEVIRATMYAVRSHSLFNNDKPEDHNSLAHFGKVYLAHTGQFSVYTENEITDPSKIIWLMTPATYNALFCNDGRVSDIVNGTSNNVQDSSLTGYIINRGIVVDTAAATSLSSLTLPEPNYPDGRDLSHLTHPFIIPVNLTTHIMMSKATNSGHIDSLYYAVAMVLKAYAMYHDNGYIRPPLRKLVSTRATITTSKVIGLSCPVCLSHPKKIGVLRCGHLICPDCKDSLVEKACCECRAKFGPRDYTIIYPSEGCSSCSEVKTVIADD